VSGAILPIVALGFIKSLVDYIRPAKIEEIKAEFEKAKSIEDELKREDSIEHGEVEESHETIEDINTDKTLTEIEKSRKIEQRIKRALLNNPELKEKMVAEIKRIEDEDKYPKESNSEVPSTRIYGAM
jgi:hypothetical protein